MAVAGGTARPPGINAPCWPGEPSRAGWGLSQRKRGLSTPREPRGVGPRGRYETGRRESQLKPESGFSWRVGL